VRIFHGGFVIIAFLLTWAALWFRRDLRLWMLFSIPLYSALMHAILVAKPRYNMPPFALLVVCGCVAAAWLLARRQAGSAPSTYRLARPNRDAHGRSGPGAGERSADASQM
jgi:hypothetical protein